MQVNLADELVHHGGLSPTKLPFPLSPVQPGLNEVADGSNRAADDCEKPHTDLKPILEKFIHALYSKRRLGKSSI
jgi:hypothetical protein